MMRTRSGFEQLERTRLRHRMHLSGVRQASRPAVMWVGISNKPETVPLASHTATGKVVAEMEDTLEGLRFHKTNLVKHAPLDSDGRLRYPTQEEMAEGAESLLQEVEQLQPSVVVTLGAVVSKIVIERVLRESRFKGLGKSFSYKPRTRGQLYVLPVHHPSFVLIYQRKRLRSYIAVICRWILEIVASFERDLSLQGARNYWPVQLTKAFKAPYCLAQMPTGRAS